MNPFAVALSSALAGDVKLNLEGFDVICRKSDGFVNASALCRAYNATASRGRKEYNQWIVSKGHQDFMVSLYCDIMNIKKDELRSSVMRKIEPPRILGGSEDEVHGMMTSLARSELERYTDEGRYDKATWVHPQVAIAIAQWISPDFAVRVSKWIYELFIIGTAHLSFSRSSSEILEEQLRQMNLAVQEKDSTISRLELRILSMEKEMRTSSALLLREISDTREELHETHGLVADLSERAVPVIKDKGKLEVFMLFRVLETVDEIETMKYLMRGVQRLSVASAKYATKKKYGDGKYFLLRTWENTPNAMMMKEKIREKMGKYLKIVGNEIIPLVPVTDDMIISCIDDIYRTRVE